ncbi:bacterial extracellular solute-binding s, 5 Middle family protein [Candidatus Phytoplasma oryzae]|uniref:Bacterial extracellular solute-binding s, 5 Middle family protein n=1 Tax=Candidatus Phytoplasma oryzae TaxID=203274 RepID=A0A139JQJ1_9MOLU|nr:ABC transporter substrate-binding protein [Candidatus Phytoplasma oryzae]KXT29120.1 bacterial extracellular solute-binding s, 5 Middle family protein [Candidatus Phytoplasma oryzae]RAM57562.1 hypothetical protein DH96_02475 [Candidatus Phytoplasma oryzae]
MKLIRKKSFWIKISVLLLVIALAIFLYVFLRNRSKEELTKTQFKDTLMVGTTTEIKNGFGIFGAGENTTNHAQVRNLIHEYLIRPVEIKLKGKYHTDYKPVLITKIPELKDMIKKGPFKDYFEFDLKQGIKFHNGDELTNDDVVATLEMNSNYKGEHSQFIEKFQKSSDPNQKYKFYIKFKNSEDLLNSHHLSKIPIINRKIKEQKADLVRSIGLGPFKLTKIDPNTKAVELDIFEEYYQNQKRNNNIKKIIIRLIPSLQTLYMNLENGKLDLILENVEQVYLEKIKQNDKLKLLEYDNLNLTYILLNSDSLSIENRKSIVSKLTPQLKEQILLDLGEDLSHYQVVNSFSDNRLKGALSEQEFNDIIKNENQIVSNKPNKKIRALFTNLEETKNRFMNKFIEYLENDGFKVEKLQFEKNEVIGKAKAGEFDIFCLTEYLENTFTHYLLNIYFGRINKSQNTNVVQQDTFENTEAYCNLSFLDDPEIYNRIDRLKTEKFNKPEYEKVIKEIHSLLIKQYVAIPLFQVNKIRNVTRSNIEDLDIDIFGEIDWLKIKKK